MPQVLEPTDYQVQLLQFGLVFSFVLRLLTILHAVFLAIIYCYGILKLQ